MENQYELIEVKPKELITINMDKISYAQKFCKKNNMLFKIITGEDICNL